MAEVVIRARVFARNTMGQFISECEAAKHKTVESTAEVGERAAVAAAPRKTGLLASSIKGEGRGSQAHLEANAPWALIQELGAAPHSIDGSPLAFPWAKSPTGHFVGPHVNHPGNPGRHYLLAGFHAMSATVMQFAAAYYPG